LAHSLGQSKAKGYSRQITVVHELNSTMLMTIVQLFGFEIIGHIKTKRIFQRPISSWNIDNIPGKGTSLTF
jgi:hypothetical protein